MGMNRCRGISGSLLHLDLGFLYIYSISIACVHLVVVIIIV